MTTITPFLWFESQAEEAMHFYASVFPDSKVIAVHGAPGKAMSVEFELNGQRLMALNGGPMFKLNEAFSLFVGCDTQDEIDEFWAKLVAGGSPSRCGWLKDQYGVSWQIVPKVLGRLLGDPDPARAQRVMQAMMQMSKLDLGALQRARDGA